MAAQAILSPPPAAAGLPRASPAPFQADPHFYSLYTRRLGRSNAAVLLIVREGEVCPYLPLCQLNCLLPDVPKTSLQRCTQTFSVPSTPYETAMIRHFCSAKTPTHFVLVRVDRFTHLLEHKCWGSAAMRRDLQLPLTEGYASLQRVHLPAREPPRPPSLPPEDEHRQLPLAPLPLTLPALSPAALAYLGGTRRQYGITVVCPALLAPGAPLPVQLESLIYWLTAHFRADRPVGLGLNRNQRSIDNHKAHLNQMMGAMQICCPEIEDMDLHSFRDHFNPAVLQALAFFRHRLGPSTSLRPHVLTAERVLHFLKASAAVDGRAYSGLMEQQHQQQLDFLHKLKSSHLARGAYVPPLDSNDMRARNMWAEPEAVVKAAHVMLERAWASYRDFLAGGGSLEPEQRRYHDRETLLECFSLMNAFLAQVTTFAWWPPLRVQPLTSIHHPSCLPEHCVEMGCEIPNCRGNTCLRGADGKWTIRLVHHKTTGRGLHGTVTIPVPSELTSLFDLVIERAWPILTHASRATTLLVTPDHGKPFKGSFARWFKEHLCPLIGATFPPKMLRRIWVESRLGDPDAALVGPSHEAAAVCMANSVPTWQRVYDSQGRGRAAAAAVEDMREWRAACLTRAGVTGETEFSFP